MDGKPYTVIGAMPQGFEFPLVTGQLNRTELWVPMSFRADELLPVAAANWSYQMVGRLKPNFSAAQAQSDAETVAQEIMRNFPPMSQISESVRWFAHCTRKPWNRPSHCCERFFLR